MARKRDILIKYEKVVNFFLKISKILPKKFYLFILKFTRNWSSYIAVFIRYICLKNCARRCGNNVFVFSNVYLYNIENLEIGDNVSIHPMCYIESSGGIKIQDNVSIAHATTIISEEHLYNDLNINIKDQGMIYKSVLIENNVWIGAGVRILSGSKIRSGSIVAAGAVVTNDVLTNSIVGGVPARVIKER
ncbi:acyltransferase [Oceanobacillus oncorhynchi subsp. oncorhynchi]|uniref:acyltransferase n=1 Tax=Oceanobacillus oncorhynchi TaxID=545501 RepID=UPI0036459ECD